MDYDTWLTTHPDEYEIDIYEDYIHVDDVEKYEDAKEYIKTMIDCFYRNGDLHRFEESLEELSAIYNLKLPYANPQFIKIEENNNVPFIKLKVKNF